MKKTLRFYNGFYFTAKSLQGLFFVQGLSTDDFKKVFTDYIKDLKSGKTIATICIDDWRFFIHKENGAIVMESFKNDDYDNTKDVYKPGYKLFTENCISLLKRRIYERLHDSGEYYNTDAEAEGDKFDDDQIKEIIYAQVEGILFDLDESADYPIYGDWKLRLDMNEYIIDWKIELYYGDEWVDTVLPFGDSYRSIEQLAKGGIDCIAATTDAIMDKIKNN